MIADISFFQVSDFHYNTEKKHRYESVLYLSQLLNIDCYKPLTHSIFVKTHCFFLKMLTPKSNKLLKV